MAFLIIPICYVDPPEEETDDDDDEIEKIRKKSLKKKKPIIKYANITINTHLVCSFVGVEDSGHTMVNMSDGNQYECMLEIEKFDTLFKGADAIIDLSAMYGN
jgi:hypothetical protein